VLLAAPLLAAISGLPVTPAHAATPPIRISAQNTLPACVTPDRLMEFLRSRNDRLDPRFKDIAHWYKRHGEAWRVRWDYAFFQMAVETNFLTFSRGDGRRGDVDPRQNNFAGIGTTGGGVPGDRYPDVATGVLAQIQHLVVYSGERIERPVAPRTQLKQDDILLASAPVAQRRPVTFADLAGRWAVDRRYGASIEWVAENFRRTHCTGRPVEAIAAKAPRPQAWPAPVITPAATAATPLVAPAPVPAVRHPREDPRPSPFDAFGRSSLGAGSLAAAPAPPAPCAVSSASYGGTRTLLIRAEAAGAVRLTTLQVLDGLERSLAASYIETRAPGGAIIGEFANREGALAKAYELCPGAAAR
jgi:hypothetical protein